MSWALKEFFAAVEEEFGVTTGDSDGELLKTPGQVIDFIVENTEPTDGMADDDIATTSPGSRRSWRARSASRGTTRTLASCRICVR